MDKQTEKHQQKKEWEKMIDEDLDESQSQLGGGGQEHQPPNISRMEPTTIGAYGGGLYGTDDEPQKPRNPPASETQSADGPVEQADKLPPKNKPPPPPSTGDRDIDITGQSYIQ